MMRPKMTLPALPLGLASLLPAAAGAEEAPKFSDYPGAPVHHGRNAAPMMASPDARTYHTRIRESAKEKPNSDGHYIVTGWGCGTNCLTSFIIDVSTGKVTMLPAMEAGMRQDAEVIDYRLDSRLIVLNGIIEEKHAVGSQYFEFDGSRLKPVKTILRPEWDEGAPESDKPQ
jgi:hypothetical protein